MRLFSIPVEILWSRKVFAFFVLGTPFRDWWCLYPFLDNWIIIFNKVLINRPEVKFSRKSSTISHPTVFLLPIFYRLLIHKPQLVSWRTHCVIWVNTWIKGAVITRKVLQSLSTRKQFFFFFTWASFPSKAVLEHPGETLQEYYLIGNKNLG